MEEIINSLKIKRLVLLGWAQKREDPNHTIKAGMLLKKNAEGISIFLFL